MRFVDLFAGIGGFHYGLERANDNKHKPKKSNQTNSKNGWFRNSNKQRKGVRFANNASFRCVWANDWDKYANQIYQKNFCKSVDRNKDRRSEKDKEGIPKKGKRLESEKGKKISNEKRFDGEHSNSNSKQGEFNCIDTRDIRTVKASEIPNHDLLTAGFPCQAFSVAGKRLGFNDTRGTLFFEIARILKHKRPRLVLLENVKGLLSHEQGKTFQTIIGVLSDLGYRVEWQVLNSKNFGVPQNRERVFIIGHLRGESKPKVFPIGEDDQVSAEEGKTNQGWTQTKVSHALRGGNVKADKVFIKENMKIRRLTPTECERLQGFPDGWTKYGTEGEISDTQRYKTLGNAVTCPVITAIGRELYHAD